MAPLPNYIAAPEIDAKTLWKLSPDEFNEWRKKNDYPRIIAFLKLKLPSFEEWMQDQNITDDILIEFSPSKLIQEIDKVYIYYLSKQDVLKKVVHEKKYEKGELFYHGFIIQNKVEIMAVFILVFVKKRRGFVTYSR